MRAFKPAPARRTLLALAAAVLAAHLMLLKVAPGPVHVAPMLGKQPFITRSIAAQPIPAVAVPALQPAAVRPTPVVAVRRGAAPVSRGPSVALAATVTSAKPASTPVAQAPPPAQPAAQAPAQAPGVPIGVFSIPGSTRLHYQVTAQVRGLTWSGEGELLWRHDGESYEARLQVSAPLLPTRTQHSTGRITAQGLAPLRFSDKTRSEEAAHFERDKGKVSFSSNRPDAPLLAGAQDRLSVMLQLGAMIAGEPAKFPPATTISIQTASTRDAEPWQFTVESTEVLQLPGGTVSALKLTRNPRREFDQKVELWLAPAMDYVPVRLRLTQPNADSVDQQWSSTDRG